VSELTPDIFVFQLINMRPFIKGSLKGLCPFKNYPSPSPLKERGIKRVRLINE
jgi:hypothetical protein